MGGKRKEDIDELKKLLRKLALLLLRKYRSERRSYGGRTYVPRGGAGYVRRPYRVPILYPLREPAQHRAPKPRTTERQSYMPIPRREPTYRERIIYDPAVREALEDIKRRLEPGLDKILERFEESPEILEEIYAHALERVLERRAELVDYAETLNDETEVEEAQEDVEVKDEAETVEEVAELEALPEPEIDGEASEYEAEILGSEAEAEAPPEAPEITEGDLGVIDAIEAEDLSLLEAELFSEVLPEIERVEAEAEEAEA